MQPVDALIESVAAQAGLESGIAPAVLAARGMRVMPVMVEEYRRSGWANRWTPEEEQFLREQIGLMSDEQIGAALGRSAFAIKIHRQRKGIPAHSKRPGWLTGNGAAKLMGVDVHNVMRLCRRGFLPHQVMPGERGILMVREAVLYRWAVNPLNWVYFRLEKVRDARLRRMLELKQARWDDEWWTIGQAAAWHGADDAVLNNAFHDGRLRGKKWGNWWVLRSEATRPGVHFWRGKGSNATVEWSEAMDAFLVLGRAVGISCNALGRMTRNKNSVKTNNSDYRLRILRRDGLIPGIIEKYGLQVEYDSERGVMWADWREHRERFPAVARAMDKFKLGRRLRGKEIFIVRGVLAARLDWQGINGPRMVTLKWGMETAVRKLMEMWRALEGYKVRRFEG